MALHYSAALLYADGNFRQILHGQLDWQINTAKSSLELTDSELESTSTDSKADPLKSAGGYGSKLPTVGEIFIWPLTYGSLSPLLR